MDERADVEPARQVTHVVGEKSLEARDGFDGGAMLPVKLGAAQAPPRMPRAEVAREAAVPATDIDEASLLWNLDNFREPVEELIGARRGSAGRGIEDALLRAAALSIDSVRLVD